MRRSQIILEIMYELKLKVPELKWLDLELIPIKSENCEKGLCDMGHVSILPQAEFGPNDHRDDAHHFR